MLETHVSAVGSCPALRDKCKTASRTNSIGNLNLEKEKIKVGKFLLEYIRDHPCSNFLPNFFGLEVTAKVAVNRTAHGKWPQGSVKT